MWIISRTCQSMPNDKRKKLGWTLISYHLAASELDYERKSNKLVKCGVPVNKDFDPFGQQVLQSSKKPCTQTSKTYWWRKRRGKKR